MNRHPNIAMAALIAAGALFSHSVHSEDVRLGDIGRILLMKEDLSVPGREVVQVRVDFPPGATAVRHSHPGEELVYVIEGVLEYRLDGRTPVTLSAGNVLLIPYGMHHAVRNVGSGTAAELATYIADKGKPLSAIGQ